jgi:hypothetical protein
MGLVGARLSIPHAIRSLQPGRYGGRPGLWVQWDHTVYLDVRWGRKRPVVRQPGAADHARCRPSQRRAERAQTLMGIEGHAVPYRASMQIAANGSNFFLNWVTTTTTTGTFAQSVNLGQPFAAAMTLDYNAGAASLFFGQVKNTISGSTKSVNQWDEANFGNSVVGGINEGNYLNGVVLFAAAWNIALPDTVVFRLLQDPFEILVFPDDDMMAEIGGGARMTTSLLRGAHGFPR